MSSRTLKVQTPAMHGDDCRDWEQTLDAQMKTWGVDLDVKRDGKYGMDDRSLTATVCHGLGLANATEAMKDGLTPDLRTKLRNKHQTPDEKRRFDERAGWRKDLAERYAHQEVASPLQTILQSSWGWHPGVHDGVDLICAANAPLLAICRAKVIRVDDSWWGLGAPKDQALKDKGDGIIVIRSLTDKGPFKNGLNFAYGHAEKPTVREGETVEAGEKIGLAGLANAWHTHFMVNGRPDDRGVGDRDPMPYVNYGKAHS